MAILFNQRAGSDPIKKNKKEKRQVVKIKKRNQCQYVLAL